MSNDLNNLRLTGERRSSADHSAPPSETESGWWIAAKVALFASIPAALMYLANVFLQ